MSAARDRKADFVLAGLLAEDDATPFPWGEIRRARAKKVKPVEPPFDPADMQAVAVALFGECQTCGDLLEVDGSCPSASRHPKHECPDCGAENDDPITAATPCLFETEHTR